MLQWPLSQKVLVPAGSMSPCRQFCDPLSCILIFGPSGEIRKIHLCCEAPPLFTSAGGWGLSSGAEEPLEDQLAFSITFTCLFLV